MTGYSTVAILNVYNSKKKKKAGNLENLRSEDRSTWENAVEKLNYKVFVFIPVLLPDKKLR